MTSIVDGSDGRECNGCGLSEVNVTLYDISLPPTIPRQFLCKKCLNIMLDSERKKRGGVS